MFGQHMWPLSTGCCPPGPHRSGSCLPASGALACTDRTVPSLVAFALQELVCPTASGLALLGVARILFNAARPLPILSSPPSSQPLRQPPTHQPTSHQRFGLVASHPTPLVNSSTLQAVHPTSLFTVTFIGLLGHQVYLHPPHASIQFVSVKLQTSANMSAPVEQVTAQMANTTLDNAAPATTESTGAQQPTAAEDEAVRASAAEGRRLYIGNLAYATTEGELKDFFKDYLV